MLKYTYPNKIFVHRIDGPISSYNTKHDLRDNLVYLANKYIADATIFQSNYSFRENISKGLALTNAYTIITNTANPLYFYPYDKLKKNKRIIIVSSSWSTNMNKGFEYYSWLDSNLDFNIFDYYFIGRSPIVFKNIKVIPPLCSKELGLYLQKCDIYLTASLNDPCSNSLIEALSCGLPVVYLNSGGHPELVKNNGIPFDNYENLISAIYDCKNNFLNKKVYYLNNMPTEYRLFFKSLQSTCLKSKKLSFTMLLILSFVYKVFRVFNRLLVINLFLKKLISSYLP